MKKTGLIILLSILLSFGFMPGFTQGLCFDGNNIIKLKKGGINDKTINLIIKEKIIETCRFTVEEIIGFIDAGLSNETIQTLIKEGSFIKDTEPAVYGKEIRSIDFTNAKDIIELKNAGISDQIIRAIIIYRSDTSNDDNRKQAWEMLKNMGIILDKR